MKKLLLLTVLAACTTSVAARTDALSIDRGNFAPAVPAPSSTHTIKSIPSDIVVTNTDGIKQLTKNRMAAKLRVPSAKASVKSSTKDGYVLYENFSGWNGEDPTWTPDGWVVDHRGQCDREDSWTPATPSAYLPLPVDGDYYYGINYSDETQDEWFISPEVKLGDDMQLSYWVYFSPIYFYSTDNIDWDTYEYIGDKEVVLTLQILIQEEGGEWTLLRDYADEYSSMTAEELMLAQPSGLIKQSISLDSYNGKTVKVAFRYYGSDGDSMFIDAIGISLPTLDDVCYLPPFNSLFWGFDNEWNMLTTDCAFYPVEAPITWMNYSGDDATFLWEYSDPESGETAVSDDQDELTVTYHPAYTTEGTPKTQLHESPTLHATAEGSAPATYTSEVKVFQTGAAPGFSGDDNSEFRPTLFQFAINGQGYTRITVSDDSQGAYSVPVFGHNQFTNNYWLNFSLNGEEALEGNFSHLLGIGNVFFASSEAALVVKGITAYGWGKIADDACLSATIYALNSEMSADYTTFETVAKATITGAEIEALYGDKAEKDFLFMSFKFESPVAIIATEDHPAYVVMLEGFNSDKVEYFAPLQSQRGDRFDQTFGYILNEINLSGHIDRGTYYSFKRMVYKDGDDYVDPTGAFALGLDAEYPWLTSASKEIVMSESDEVVNIALSSYYDANTLEIEAPEGLSATVTGQYEKCVLTVKRTANEEIDGIITVKGTGVGLSLPVKAEASSAGISEIETDTAAGKIYFDLSGRKVTSPAPGIYITKSPEGKAAKTIVR